MGGWINADGGKRSSRDEVSASVRTIKNFQGVIGAIEFDNKGDPLPAKHCVSNMTSRFIGQSHLAASAGGGEKTVVRRKTIK